LFSVPPQLRTGESWYLGTADAVLQNLYILQEQRPQRVPILSGDHLYKMDYSETIEAHIRAGALVTAAVVECDLKTASRMGVLEVSEDNRILAFKEKPDKPEPIPGRPRFAWANIGVYVFDTPILMDAISGKSEGDPVLDFG
jgi:glucose-1-phosphate adenylyltransferase